MTACAVPGPELYFERTGRGHALLLIPGALGTGAGDFPGQIDWFARQGFEVIAPDPRGYGRSRPPERDYPLDFFHRDAADMFALMSALGHERFNIIGWSDGGNIAIIMAAERPARVARIAVFGGQSFLAADDIAALNNVRMISAWSPRAAKTMRAVYGDALDDLWERYIVGQKALFDAGGDLYTAMLAKVKCPTFVLHGAKDPLTPSLHAETIHRAISGSRLHIFPEGRHNIHIRYADEFNNLVHAFLTEPDGY